MSNETEVQKKRRTWPIVVAIALAAVLVGSLVAWLVQPKTPAPTPSPSASQTATAKPTSSATKSPSASTTPSPSATGSTTPTTTPSPTATAEDCTPTSQYYRIGQCAVPGKTPAQVLEACTIAANGNMWGQSFSSGKEYSDKVIAENSKICLAGSNLKVSADAPIDVAGCPSGCADYRGKGKLAYIVLSGMTVGRSSNVVVSLPFKADGTAIRGSNAAPNAVAMVDAWYKSFEEGE